MGLYWEYNNRNSYYDIDIQRYMIWISNDMDDHQEFLLHQGLVFLDGMLLQTPHFFRHLSLTMIAYVGSDNRPENDKKCGTNYQLI